MYNTHIRRIGNNVRHIECFTKYTQCTHYITNHAWGALKQKYYEYKPFTLEAFLAVQVQFCGTRGSCSGLSPRPVDTAQQLEPLLFNCSEWTAAAVTRPLRQRIPNQVMPGIDTLLYSVQC